MLTESAFLVAIYRIKRSPMYSFLATIQAVLRFID